MTYLIIALLLLFFSLWFIIILKLVYDAGKVNGVLEHLKRVEKMVKKVEIQQRRTKALLRIMRRVKNE